MATQQIPAGYRLVPDDNQAPEARGKAAALSAYLARKGSPKAGKRLDRAVAKFETMWAQAPVELKEKYAGRSQKTDLAPSERGDLAPIPRPTNASLNAARPGESASQAKERQRQSRAGTKPAPGNSFAELTKPVPLPEGGVNSVGDGVFEAGKAKRIEQANALMEDAKKNPPTEAQKSPPDTYVPDKATPPPAASPQQQAAATPPGKAYSDEYSDGFLNSAAKGEKYPTREEAGKPFKDPGLALGDNYEAEEATRQANNAKIEADNAKQGLSPLGGAVTPPSSAPAPATAVAGQPPIPSPTYRGPMAQGATPTGSPVMETPKSTTGQPMDPAIKSDNGAGLTRVNRLTGLPFGFSPGNALPKSAGADMQQRASDSQTRQSQAQAAAPTRPAAPVAGPRPMPRGPASQPVATGTVVPPVASPKQVADDPDILRKGNVARANYQSGFSGGNPGDAEHTAAKDGQKKLYDGASEMDKIRLGRQTAEDAARQTRELDASVANAPRASNPANTRVVARRPATPEESRTGRVMPPARRPMALAR